jgi:hypothetical protein
MKRLALTAYACSSRRTQGTVLVATMVCLAVAMTLVGSMLRSTLQTRRTLQTERQLRQVERLLEAGLVRARQKFADDPSYRGETWRIPADLLDGQCSAEVLLEWVPQEDGPRMKVIARYPVDRESPIQRSRQLLLTRAPGSDSAPGASPAEPATAPAAQSSPIPSTDPEE